jgi:integrase
MQWSELSDDFSTLRLPAARVKNNKAHVVPLSAQARAVLAELPRLSNDHVFTIIGNVPISNFGEYKARLDSLMLMEAVKEHGSQATIVDWRLHDLRRSAATGMAGIGIAPHVIEAVLNHATGFKGGVAGVYNTYDYENEKRHALDRWGAHVERIVSGADVRNVVPMRR